MKRGIMLFIILASVSILTLNPVSATEERFGCHITITPTIPTTSDEVVVSVSFLFHTDPPFVAEFSPVVSNNNVFSINATLVVPRADDAVLQIVHMENHTYHLGKLQAGDYVFEVYGKTQGNGQTWLEKEATFNVATSVRSAPEFPSLASLMLLLVTATIIVFTTKKASKKNSASR